MKNILIATDLSEKANRALARAVHLAAETGAALHVLFVMPEIYHPHGGSHNMTAEAKSMISAHIDSQNGSSDLDIKIYVEEGHAFEKIIELSQDLNVDLVVMGTHGKAHLRDLFVGTTIERVIRKGIKPVLMVLNKPEGGYKKVVAGTDFSGSSMAAVALAGKIAPGSDFELVHSYEFSNTYTGYKIEKIVGDVIRKNEGERLEDFARDCKTVLKADQDGVKNFKHRSEEGPVFETLERVVRETGADLLAIGMHGRTHMAFARLGGAAEDILSAPPCDVLVSRDLPVAE